MVLPFLTATYPVCLLCPQSIGNLHVDREDWSKSMLGLGFVKLEDLKVLRRSPDLLNNVKIGKGQLQLIMEQILFLPYTLWSSDKNRSSSLEISEKKMFR